MDMNLGHTQLIIEKAREAGLLRNQLAYVLATAYWETARTMEPVREAYWLSENWRRNNLRYYPWYGRGFVQLTWQRNYLHAGQQLDRDFITNPDAVMEPDASAEILVIGSRDGWFTGRKLSDYITLQKSDYIGARRVINGTDKARQIADLARAYEHELLGVGYGNTPEPPDDDAKPAPLPVPTEVTDVVTKTEKPAHESTTNIVSVLLGGLGSIGAFLADLHPAVQGLLVVLIGVGVVYIIRERQLKSKRARAAREALSA